ncbi:hypothetical protein FBULB1_8798 [Fusarium bulbicola]|nr:hypothetical protein FBULB1_8798 [Fusarium bulbicola]
MTTFEGFTDLPRELRDRIWSLAIRHDHPGAHVFGQCTTGSRHIQSRTGMSFDLAAPSWRRYFETVNEYRSDENISTYLIDGGLWTACHESRCIMEKHFTQSKRQLAPRHPNDYRTSFSQAELFRTATSGYFDGTPLEIVTVFPLRDLFILQHDDLDGIDWDCLGFDASLATSREGFYGANHIAIEYDQAWGDESRQDDVLYKFSQACVGVPYLLWFIDRCLKQKSQAPMFEEESDRDWKINAFYASDRKFLEIKDYGTLFKDWEYIGPVQTNWYDHICDSLEFVRELEDKIAEQKVTDGSEAEEPCVVGLLGRAPL